MSKPATTSPVAIEISASFDLLDPSMEVKSPPTKSRSPVTVDAVTRALAFGFQAWSTAPVATFRRASRPWNVPATFVKRPPITTQSPPTGSIV